jgi:hypothetical protein
MQTDYVTNYFAAQGKAVDSVQVLTVPTSLNLIDDLEAFDYVFDYSSGVALGYADKVALNDKAQKWYTQSAKKPSQAFKPNLMLLLKLVDVTCSTFGWTERVVVTDYLEDLAIYESDQSNNYLVNLTSQLRTSAYSSLGASDQLVSDRSSSLLALLSSTGS